MHKNAVLFLLALLFTNNVLRAQQRDQDLASWLNVSLEKKFSKKFSVFASPNIRINKNLGELNSYFIDLTAEYKFKGPLSASINYRQGKESNRSLVYMGFHRIYWDLNYKKRFFKKVTFSLRLRYQEQLGAIFREEGWNISRRTFRIRYKFAPKWDSRFVPYFANEYFFRFNWENRGWNKARITGGVEYEIDKRKSVEFYYTMQRDAFQSGRELDHILGMTFNLTL